MPYESRRERRDTAKKRAGRDTNTNTVTSYCYKCVIASAGLTEPHAGVESSTGSAINTYLLVVGTVPLLLRIYGGYVCTQLETASVDGVKACVSVLCCRRRVQGCEREEPTCDPPVNPGSMQNSSRAHGEFAVKEENIAPWDYAV